MWRWQFGTCWTPLVPHLSHSRHLLLQPLLGMPPLSCTLHQVPPVICLELFWHLDGALTQMQPGSAKKEVTPHRQLGQWGNGSQWITAFSFCPSGTQLRGHLLARGSGETALQSLTEQPNWVRDACVGFRSFCCTLGSLRLFSKQTTCTQASSKTLLSRKDPG